MISENKTANRTMPRNSYIKQTGQAWKIWLFLFPFAGSGVLISSGIVMAGPDHDSLFGSLIFGGTCLGVAAFIWLLLSLKCRKCGTYLTLRAMKGQWIFVGETCPVCHDDGDDETVEE